MIEKRDMMIKRIGIICTVISVILSVSGCGAVKPKKVYLASPFFNQEEVKNVEYVESILSQKGLSYFSPMHNDVDGEHGTLEWAEKIYSMDKAEIDKADIVVALDYGNYGDTGTAWECGYATAAGKPVILVHVYRDGDSNLMLHCGSVTNVYLDELADYDFETMPVYDYNGKMY